MYWWGFSKFSKHSKVLKLYNIVNGFAIDKPDGILPKKLTAFNIYGKLPSSPLLLCSLVE